MSSYMNRETITMVAAVVALLGVLFLFSENKKLKSAINSPQPQSLAQVPLPPQPLNNQGSVPQQTLPTPVTETSTEQVKN